MVTSMLGGLVPVAGHRLWRLLNSSQLLISLDLLIVFRQLGNI